MRPSRMPSASMVPPRCRGWLAITPIGWPSNRAKPQTMLRAQWGATSKKLSRSTIRAATSRTS